MFDILHTSNEHITKKEKKEMKEKEKEDETM